MDNQKYSLLPGDAPCRSFGEFLPKADNPFPDNRIFDFIVLGPFVLETDGSFETEYFYQREKVLDCDYLADSGGQAAQVPCLGARVSNKYYGPATLEWKRGYRKWGSLRFDKEGESCDDALFATQQRNCVYYAAVYIDCDRDERAVICYENSGCLLFLNGELIDSKPYGRVKGMPTRGNTVAVTFRQGRNLLMFKLRTGYIADTIDLSMSNCAIHPVAVQCGGLGITYPYPTASFFGSRSKPLQAFPCFAAAFADTPGGEAVCECRGHTMTEQVPALSKGEARTVRLLLPCGKDCAGADARLSVSCSGERSSASIVVNTLPLPDFEGTAYLFSDFHFDTTYHQEQRTYALGAFFITKCLVDKLISDLSFKVILSEVDYLHAYYSIYPQHRPVIRQAFLEGRAQADCFYNQPNELTSSGEGFVRNLVYGQLYHREVLGSLAYIYAPGDVFGHPNQLSQICLKGGCTAVRWGKTVLGLDSVFRHVSPDGTVAVHDKGVGRYDAQRLGLHHCCASADACPGVPAYPCEETSEWMKGSLENARYGLLSEMVDGICRDIEQAQADGDSKVDLTSRDLTQHHSGVLLTRTDFKQANRLAENLLISAEKFACFAAMLGARHPDKALDLAWRQLLCAQHHDSITGTNNEISFIDLMVEYREAAELAADILRRSTSFIASGIDLPDGKSGIAVFNPHAFERYECCTVDIPPQYRNGCCLVSQDGREYTVSINDNGTGIFTPLVPSLGYASFTFAPAAPDRPQGCGGATISNEYLRVTCDERLGGGIVSVIDLETGRELLRSGSDLPANRVAVLREVADRMEAQHEVYTTGQKLFSSDYPASIQCEKCEAYERLSITVKLDVIATLRQTVTLYRSVRRIDMQTIIEDYQGSDDLFTITFPIDIKGARPVFDDRFAPHIWSAGQRKLSFQTHQYASFSHSKIAPVNQWFEYGGTVRAVFDGRGDINLGMTAVIRSGKLCRQSDALLLALTKKAVPVTAYSDTAQYGSHKLVDFNEDLDNTDTRFVLSVSGIPNEYEQDILERISAEKRALFDSAVSKDGSAVLFTRDCDNIYKKPIDVILIKAYDRCRLDDIIGDIASQLADSAELRLNGCVLCEEPGFTEDYGVALLNRGTIACSLEPDGLMNMMLFHTADFYGNQGKTTGGDRLIPEQKTHGFTYALYPHSGDYRRARVAKAALAFNDPLIAAPISDSPSKPLPREKSLLKCEGDFIVTSMKVGGNPLAMMKADCGSIASRGITLRGYEPNGRSGRMRLSTDLGICKVQSVNLLEENKRDIPLDGSAFDFDCPAHSIETFLLGINGSAPEMGNVSLGAERCAVEPAFVRSWEHDRGSMNMGYLNVAGIIGKDTVRISELETRFCISMANNHPDTSITGTMHLSLPDGFTADRTEFDYSVAARGVQIFELTVKKPFAGATGIMRLGYSHDGSDFEDIYEFGCFDPTAEISIGDREITVKIANNTSQRINGELSLATPFETWSVDGFNPSALLDISPRCLPFDLPPGHSEEYTFAVNSSGDEPFKAFWAVAKLAANGRLHFAYAHRKGPRHNCWAHELAQELFVTDRGSIKRLLEM